jgi:hypothetical protein
MLKTLLGCAVALLALAAGTGTSYAQSSHGAAGAPEDQNVELIVRDPRP